MGSQLLWLALLVKSWWLEYDKSCETLVVGYGRVSEKIEHLLENFTVGGGWDFEGGPVWYWKYQPWGYIVHPHSLIRLSQLRHLLPRALPFRKSNTSELCL